MYVAIEGVDTCGKSTQVELLKNEFKEALFIKEPGFTKLGAKIRDIVLHDSLSDIARMFLFLADRAELYEKEIKQAKDRTIISDRSAISGIAYATSVETESLISMNAIALQGFFPQKCVVLELDERTLKERLSRKSQDKIESKGFRYLLFIQERIISVAKLLNVELLRLDASEDRGVILSNIKKFILS